jgi:hypothetical protein
MDIYLPGQPRKTIGLNDELDSGDVLPGFSIPLKEIFSQL